MLESGTFSPDVALRCHHCFVADGMLCIHLCTHPTIQKKKSPREARRLEECQRIKR